MAGRKPMMLLVAALMFPLIASAGGKQKVEFINSEKAKKANYPFSQG